MKLEKLHWIALVTLVAVLSVFFFALSHSRSASPAATEAAILSGDFIGPVVPETEPADDGFEEFEATAYAIYGVTFSGVVVQPGIVAADPAILPIGSVIELRAGKYSGIYTVMDTGAVIKGRIIDIYMPEYEEAIEFGRQTVQIQVLRHGWHPDTFTGSSFSVAG